MQNNEQQAAASTNVAQHSRPLPTGNATTPPSDSTEILALLEKLANLHDAGVLTAEEFGAKKAELLARL